MLISVESQPQNHEFRNNPENFTNDFVRCMPDAKAPVQAP